MERDRVTVGEAARRLGISESGVRKRVQRGQLDSTREEDGRVYVYLDTSPTSSAARTEEDTVRDEFRDKRSWYVERLEDEIEFLRDQVRRQQEIIGQQAISLRALSASPELEAPQRPSEPRERASEEREGESPGPEPGGPQEPISRQRSWWRRWFGGE